MPLTWASECLCRYPHHRSWRGSQRSTTVSNLLPNMIRTFGAHHGARKNFSFDRIIIINYNKHDNSSIRNQRVAPLGQVVNLFGMPAMGTSENGSPTTMVNILCQVLDNHSLISPCKGRWMPWSKQTPKRWKTFKRRMFLSESSIWSFKRTKMQTQLWQWQPTRPI